MGQTIDILAVARFRARSVEIRKSRAAGAQPPQLTVHKQPRKPRKPPQPAQATPGAFVRVQRGDMHSQPVLARVVSAGEHGIVAMESTGRRIKVRHEHVVEKAARPTARERAMFHGDLASTGIPVALHDRFLRLDPQGQAQRRPTISQRELLGELTAHGVPIDLERIEDATYDDVEEILHMYVDDPAGKIGKTRVNR